MVYKFLESAQKRWKRIKGFKLLPLVVNDVKFKGGEQYRGSFRKDRPPDGHTPESKKIAVLY